MNRRFSGACLGWLAGHTLRQHCSDVLDPPSPVIVSGSWRPLLSSARDKLRIFEVTLMLPWLALVLVVDADGDVELQERPGIDLASPVQPRRGGASQVKRSSAPRVKMEPPAARHVDRIKAFRRVKVWLRNRSYDPAVEENEYCGPLPSSSSRNPNPVSPTTRYPRVRYPASRLAAIFTSIGSFSST